MQKQVKKPEKKDKHTNNPNNPSTNSNPSAKLKSPNILEKTPEAEGSNRYVKSSIFNSKTLAQTPNTHSKSNGNHKSAFDRKFVDYQEYLQDYSKSNSMLYANKLKQYPNSVVDRIQHIAQEATDLNKKGPKLLEPLKHSFNSAYYCDKSNIDQVVMPQINYIFDKSSSFNNTNKPHLHHYNYDSNFSKLIAIEDNSNFNNFNNLTKEKEAEEGIGGMGLQSHEHEENYEEDPGFDKLGLAIGLGLPLTKPKPTSSSKPHNPMLLGSRLGKGPKVDKAEEEKKLLALKELKLAKMREEEEKHKALLNKKRKIDEVLEKGNQYFNALKKDREDLYNENKQMLMQTGNLNHANSNNNRDPTNTINNEFSTAYQIQSVNNRVRDNNSYMDSQHLSNSNNYNNNYNNNYMDSSQKNNQDSKDKDKDKEYYSYYPNEDGPTDAFLTQKEQYTYDEYGNQHLLNPMPNPYDTNVDDTNIDIGLFKSDLPMDYATLTKVCELINKYSKSRDEIDYIISKDSRMYHKLHSQKQKLNQRETLSNHRDGLTQQSRHNINNHSVHSHSTSYQNPRVGNSQQQPLTKRELERAQGREKILKMKSYSSKNNNMEKLTTTKRHFKGFMIENLGNKYEDDYEFHLY